MNFNVNKIQDSFYPWLKSQYHTGVTKDVNGRPAPYVRTPFTNCVGDYFNIYFLVSSKKDPIYIEVDDDGETLANLSSLDIDVFAERRHRILDRILTHYHASLVKNCMLSISGKIKDLPKMELDLTKAMIKIDSLHLIQ